MLANTSPALSADEAKLKELIQRYSEFINFPIYMWTTKEVDVPIEEEEDKAEETDEATEEEEEDDVEGEGKARVPSTLNVHCQSSILFPITVE